MRHFNSSRLIHCFATTSALASSTSLEDKQTRMIQTPFHKTLISLKRKNLYTA